ncbi:uncharacterized protein [Littorina saxatilis]|uniref:uncharacterized protein n=1 Tax=Littorina saxatilis TaxID=31220 RepID=UPI0038B5F0C5
MSKNLSLHLNMAINTPRPSSITQQAFFIGQNLPALLLTVYQKAGEGDYQAARSYALEQVQHHSRVMQNYCYHEFVVLPITIEQTELSPKSIQEKIKEEVKRASVYYKQPVHLSEEAYISLRKGMAVVSAGTMMPYFLQHQPSEPKWTLQLDGQWRQLLHTFLDHMADGGDRDWLQQPPEVFPKTLIAFLEAVKRLSYTEQVTVCTSDPSIRDCLE